MIEIIEKIITGIIICWSTFYIWKNVSKKRIEVPKQKRYLIYMVYGVMLFINYYYINSFIRILLLVFQNTITYKLLFKTDTKEGFIVSGINVFIFLLSELIWVLLLYTTLGENAQNLIMNNLGTLISNVVISLIALIASKLSITYKLYQKLISITKNINQKFFAIGLVMIIITINIIFAICYTQTKTIIMLIINTLLTIVYSLIVFSIIKEKNRSIKINDKYNIATSSIIALQQVINTLRVNNHENKNELLTIRSMIKRNDKNTIVYIDKLVKIKVKDDEKLMIETSVIPNSVISSIIYSKLLYMKENNFNVVLNVDKKINSVQLQKLDDELTIDICKIIGVFIDNACEEMIKKKNKEIFLDIAYEENKNVSISISNKFSNAINIEKMNDEGYTTKGKGHGYGLSLVNQLINKNKDLTWEKEINDDVFTQKLVIKN